MDNIEQFESFIKDVWQAPNLKGDIYTEVPSGKEYYMYDDLSIHQTFIGWQACAEQKDKEIDALKKHVAAYKIADEARTKLIDWKVSEGVKAKTKELDTLSSELEVNQRLTNEIEVLRADVEFLTKAVETSHNDSEYYRKELEAIKAQNYIFEPLKYSECRRCGWREAMPPVKE